MDQPDKSAVFEKGELAAFAIFSIVARFNPGDVLVLDLAAAAHAELTKLGSPICRRLGTFQSCARMNRSTH